MLFYLNTAILYLGRSEVWSGIRVDNYVSNWYDVANQY